MKRTNLGEFEELVLLIVAILNQDAYAVSVKTEMDMHSERNAKISSIHLALYRLEDKGFLSSEIGGATAERGGRRKRYFKITRQGRNTLASTKELRNHLWELIPEVS